MIYVHNESITGINIHRKIIDRVYHGNRLVWLRNSTADSFTIDGESSIYECFTKQYRIKYAGNDDVSYSWTFSGVTPESVVYNHNKRKAIITVGKGHVGEYLEITVVMERRNNTPLTETKRVLILKNEGLIDFKLDDVYFFVEDSSSDLVRYNLEPEGYNRFSVYNSSVDSSRLYVSEYDEDGLYLSKTDPTDLHTMFNTVLHVSLLDDFIDVPYEDVELNPDRYVHTDAGWRKRLDASANVYVTTDIQSFVINDTIDVGNGDDLYNRIKIGVIVSDDVAYVGNKMIGSVNIYCDDTYTNYGLYGVSDSSTNTPYCSNGLSKLASTSKYLSRGIIHWIDCSLPNLQTTYVPRLAVKTENNIKAYISIKRIDDSEILRKCITIPYEYTNIENKIAEYVFRISNGSNGISIDFDTDLSSILSCL